MTTSYTGELSLADRFRALVKGGILPAEAPELLLDLYLSQHFHLISDLLVRDFRPDDAGKLEVELSDGSKPDPETVPTRDPYPHEEPTMALDTVFGLHRTRMREKRWQAAEQEEMRRYQAAAPAIAPPAQPDPPRPVIPEGHGGHDLRDVLRGWRRGGLSLPLCQEYLARLTSNRAIVLSEEFPAAWWLEMTRSGNRVMGDRRDDIIILAPDGKQRWADEYRCHLNDPRILDPRQLPRFLAPTVAEDPPPVKGESKSEAKIKAEAEAEAEAKIKAEAEAAEARAKADAEAEAKITAETEAKIKAEAEAAEVRVKADAEAEAKIKAETKAKLEAEAEAAEAKVKADAEAEAKIKTETEAKIKAEAEAAGARVKAEAAAEANLPPEAALEPAHAPDNGPRSKPRKLDLRHTDWPKIVKYAEARIKRGRWLNAYAAATEILEKLPGLTIDHGTLRKGILNNFPDWFGLEPKE